MEYKILINSKVVPVLVEYFEQSITMDYMQNPPKDITKEFNERLLQSAIADESKHIAFKDEKSVCLIVGESMGWAFFPQYYIGQTFDLPIGYSVSFEGEWRHNQFATGHSYVGREAPDGSETRTVAILTPKENSALINIYRDIEGDSLVTKTYKDGKLVSQKSEPLTEQVIGRNQENSAHSFTEGADVPESVPSCGEKVKTTEDAWEIQETYEGKPHGWVQWKGTDVCMDVHCKCGELTHIDGDFVYHVKCANCGTVYMVNGHVQLIELEIEPEGTKITTND